MNTKIFSETDYLKRNVEKDTDGKIEYSPMEPPDAYHPTGMIAVPYEELSPFLKHLYDEHKMILQELEKFEAALLSIRKDGITKELNQKLAAFFQFLDDKIVLHHLKEERLLFPLLHERLLNKGEHSPVSAPETAVDMLEDDHIKTMQLATLCFSLMGISSRLTDAGSRTILVDTALEQGTALVELLRLHLFREDNVVFALAHKHLTTAESERMVELLKKYFSITL
ncbi:MAG: hemerythrin domain-containing protein [Bacteroidetes bacterium]|nr:hemerythrin domain-containing protein [Bacteroidota bacterium]MBS1973200.1 hemerythrin domain-containing protein [Bacteroidota bacterium]